MNVYLLNTETMQFPIYEGDFYLLFPDTSFPNPLIEPPTPYVWVQGTAQPQYNWITQGIKEITPVEIESIWYQTWEIYELSAEQIANNEKVVKQNNKAQASTLLQSTDWTCTVDINNPQYSNPYLGNQDAFLAYRSQVRAIAVNPPTTPAIFPEVPQEVWVTV